jgi:hypothetical protein
MAPDGRQYRVQVLAKRYVKIFGKEILKKLGEHFILGVTSCFICVRIW